MSFAELKTPCNPGGRKAARVKGEATLLQTFVAAVFRPFYPGGRRDESGQCTTARTFRSLALLLPPSEK